MGYGCLLSLISVLLLLENFEFNCSDMAPLTTLSTPFKSLVAVFKNIFIKLLNYVSFCPYQNNIGFLDNRAGGQPLWSMNMAET